MKSTEYYKEFCKFFCVFIHQPSVRERPCDGGGDFVSTTDLSFHHLSRYLLLFSLKIFFLALVRMEKALSLTSLPFVYILLMWQDSIILSEAMRQQRIPKYNEVFHFWLPVKALHWEECSRNSCSRCSAFYILTTDQIQSHRNINWW